MGKVDELLVEGFRARNAFSPEVALGCFEKAVELEPGDGFILLEVGRCFVELLDLERWGETYEKVRVLADGDDELILDLARVCVSAGDVEAALVEFGRVGRGEFFVQASLEMVMLLERAHRLGEAREVLAGRGLDGKRAEVRLMEALILEREGEGVKAERILRKLWRSVPRTGFDIEVGYRLARMLDRKGRTDEALRILAACKKKEAEEMPLEAVRGFTAKRRASDFEFLESLPEDWFSDRGNVFGAEGLFILGHPRSGTSLMAKRLVDAGGVTWVDERMSFETLARGFTKGQDGVGELVDYLGGLGAGEVGEFEDGYRRSLMGEVRVPFLDKNPGLSCSLASMHNLVPNSAWLVMLRDPRDVALSCYFQRFGSSSLGVACLTLEGALEAVCHVMRYWLAVRARLGDGQFLEVRYEDLVADVNEVVERVCGALGWGGGGGEAREFLNLTPSYEAIERPVYDGAVRRWERSGVEWHMEGFGELLVELGYGE